MEKYNEMLKRHQEEVSNSHYVGFAFSQEQFKEMMNGWGLTENDTDQILRIGSGGFCQKKNYKAFMNMLDSHDAEIEQWKKDNPELVCKVEFVGIDEWNRPVFKSISQVIEMDNGEKSYAYFCDVNTLFDYGTNEREVYEKKNTLYLCYKGCRFGSEPMGTDMPYEIIWNFQQG